MPIFAAIMFLVCYLSMVTVGTTATDWANDGLFGDGWHLFGIGSSTYAEAEEEYRKAALIVDGYSAYMEENRMAPRGTFTYLTEDEETLEVTEETVTLLYYYFEGAVFKLQNLDGLFVESSLLLFTRSQQQMHRSRKNSSFMHSSLGFVM